MTGEFDSALDQILAEQTKRQRAQVEARAAQQQQEADQHARQQNQKSIFRQKHQLIANVIAHANSRLCANQAPNRAFTLHLTSESDLASNTRLASFKVRMGRPGAQIFSALYFDLLKSGKIANEISDGLNRGAPVSPEEAVELDALDQAEVESAVLRYVRIVIEDTPV